MAEAIAEPQLTAAATNGGEFGGFFQFGRPKLRVTSEYDSDSSVFLHKVSCKLLDNLAKLKLSFQNNSKGEVSEPQVTFTSKHVSLHYDVEENDALVKASFEILPGFQIKAAHQVKARQGEVAMVADLAGPAYKFELSSAVPSVGMKIVGDMLLLVSTFPDNSANAMIMICLVFVVSYWYHFDSNNWSTVYKHTVGKDYKLKAGYDSEVRLGWASLWVGDEDGKAKAAPMKMKVQFMLQVPQDDIKSSALMFRVKKRWDI
ncbi:hypothetical protein DH2020_004929 [Rehmannia glutinosa]|uniref:Uncharacterized protein n=1 Tax=Rehmannia glutinosa TaxID=99300 RepID=A0ABR0XR36_REHGL